MEQAFTRKWHSDLALEGKSDFLRQGRVIKGKEWQIRCGWGLGEWGEVEIRRAGAEAVGCPKLQSKNFKLYAIDLCCPIQQPLPTCGYSV